MAMNPEEARRRKNERQKEYQKKTNYEAQYRYQERNKGALKQLSYYLPAELAEEYKAVCKKKGISLSDVPVKAIKRFLKRENNS